MSIKSILCAYSGETNERAGLHHAVKLSQYHGAHLTGAIRRGISQLEQRLASQLSQDNLDQLHDVETRHVAEIAQRFAATCKEAGLSEASDFVELNPGRDGPLSVFAHAFDLIVTGAQSPAVDEVHLAASPDMLALKSGRPVLVVPDGYDAPGLAERAVVAWDGKRSAARAIGDAMSILEDKGHVTLLSVGKKPPRGTDRMVANLERHGVNVDARTVERNGSIAETILAEANAEGAKLIVMGAFEHSKFSHDLFGGVTTDVIAKSSVPVFMAH